MSEQVFVLTTDSIPDWECDIIRFPTPIIVASIGHHNGGSKSAYMQAFEAMRLEAEKLGANVVLGVRTSEPEWRPNDCTHAIRAIGTPAYVNPPLPDPQEYIELLRKGDNG